MQTARNSAHAAPAPPGAPGLRLLLAEDEPEAARHMADCLAAEGHVVEIAGDGLTALGTAAAETFDVLILDRMLPGLDGLSLLRALRTRGSARRPCS